MTTSIPTRLNPIARALTLRLLRDLPGGRIHLTDPDGTYTVGRPTPGDPLDVTITLPTTAAYASFLRGSRTFAGAYPSGLWEADDLVTLVRIIARSQAGLEPWRERWATLATPVRRLAAARRTNSRDRSRDNVERHYDLGNEFFALVLDETMGYSCAYWERPGMTPVEASRANLERVCRLLDLCPGDRLLEMGSGWGALAIHAARQHGCRVSTVTLSRNQHAHVEAAARAAGVSDAVEVILSDYRDVRGTWDKVVSLEMIESVGADHLHQFIGQCGRLMRPDGLALIQAITDSHRRFRIDRYRRTFLNEHIFPGGCTPSLEAILDAAARHTDLHAVAMYDITDHYPPTLRAWAARFEKNWPQILELGGFDEHFRRLWTLYLAYCEAAFLERRVQDRQLLLAGPQWRGDGRLLGQPSSPPERRRTRGR